MSNPEQQRFERHEPTHCWLDYLQQAGFAFDQPLSAIEINSELDLQQPVPGCIQLGYNHTSVLAVICATRPTQGLN